MTASGNLTIWMRLRNAREVIAGLRQTAAATGLLGTTTDRLASKLERAGRRTFIMNQALFTLRRYSYMITLGLTAATAAVVKWGFQYDSQVQQARIAFAKFGLTQAQVNDEISKLYRIAAISPFLFTDITNTARRFLAFGIDLQTTNRLVTNLADSLTALGLANTASLNRASLALAHMYSLGRVTGQVVYQLARDNVPIIQALEKELGLTGDQLRRVGDLGIPASVAIQALNKYIEETPRFHNAALLFATRTWRGIVTTTRDYVAQFLGRVEQPLFLNLQKGARRFLFWLQGAGQRGFDRGGLVGMVATFSPNAARFLRLILANARAVWNIFVNGLIPGFRYAAQVVFPALYIAIQPFSMALQFLGHHAWITRAFFALLALELGVMAIRMAILLPLQTALMVRMIATNAVQRISILLGLRELIVMRNTRGEIIATSLIYTRFGRVLRAILLFRRAEIGLMIGQILYATRLGAAMQLMWRGYAVGNFAKASYGARTLEGRILRLRIGIRALTTAVRVYTIALLTATRSMIVFLLTNPVGWIILAVAALAILYWRWTAFRNAVNRLVLFLYRNPLAALFVPVIGPLIAMVRLLREAVRWAKSLWGWLHHPLGKGGGGGFLKSALRIAAGQALGPLSLIPGLASGGRITSGGLAMVGEGGPEVLSLPKGAQVSPIGRTVGGLQGDFPIEFTLYNRTTLEADGRQLAEVVSKHRLDAQARR